MRPERFETFLQDLYHHRGGGQVTEVKTVREIGYDRHPYGLGVTYATGSRVLLQIIGVAAPGDRYDQPEKVVEGDAPPAEVPVPDPVDGGRLQLAAADRHLVALVLNSGSREVAGAEAFSARKGKPGAVRYGAKVTFHDGSVIYVYVVHALPAGRTPEKGREFDVPAAV